MIGVVDYRAGNAPSVMYALRRLRVDATLVRGPADLETVDRVVLPGVGAAAATVASLREAGLVDALRSRILDDALPFLGICIGLQVVFERSEEGPTDCLGWLPGTVRRFPDTDRVPQIGWNEVVPRRAHPLLAGWPAEPYCYFVNSYHAVPTDPAAVLGLSEYSVPFTAMVASGNVAATQFHAEKSGEVGLRILTNFSTWDGTEC
ncbi:MAG: imidazole glycerol phosphate synthase subunit HisH [Acidimicrobiia bacterium]